MIIPLWRLKVNTALALLLVPARFSSDTSDHAGNVNG
jgi:hypothetical protein